MICTMFIQYIDSVHTTESAVHTVLLGLRQVGCFVLYIHSSKFPLTLLLSKYIRLWNNLL